MRQQLGAGNIEVDKRAFAPVLFLQGSPAQPPPSSDSADGPVPRRWVLWFAAGLVLVSGCLLGLAVAYLRTQALESGERLTESLAQVVEEKTTRSFQFVDQKLQPAAAGLLQLSASGRMEQDSVEVMRRQQLGEAGFLRSLAVIDADGRIQYATDASMVGVNVAGLRVIGIDFAQGCLIH